MDNGQATRALAFVSDMQDALLCLRESSTEAERSMFMEVFRDRLASVAKLAAQDA